MAKRNDSFREVRGKQPGLDVHVQIWVTATDLVKEERQSLADHVADGVMSSIRSAPYSNIPLSHLKTSRLR